MSRGSWRNPEIPLVPRRGLQPPGVEAMKGRGPCMGTQPALTHAQPARGIQRQALKTLAVEGASGVEAAPIGTDPREDLTLVHIWAAADKEERQGLETPRSCSRGASGHHVVLGEGEGAVPASGWQIARKTQVPRRENVSISNDFREGPQAAPMTLAHVWLGGRTEEGGDGGYLRS